MERAGAAAGGRLTGCKWQDDALHKGPEEA